MVVVEIVRRLFWSLGTLVIVLIESVAVWTLMNCCKLPTRVETSVETSLREVFVAYAPRLIGEYGETRKGLLLFEAKLSAVFCSRSTMRGVGH